MIKRAYTKPKLWSGKDLKGTWQFTIKKDGVRALVDEGVVTSRNDKPLHNLNHLMNGDYEIYLGSWEDTITAVRTVEGMPPVPREYCYSLEPLDPRLHLFYIDNPSADYIQVVMESTVAAGNEGLVLRQGDKWLKVKPAETYDVTILDVVEGGGKYRNMLGSFLTEKGKVGTGISDNERRLFWFDADNLIGKTIEVECMKLTTLNMFRHPRFKRIRWDK